MAHRCWLKLQFYGTRRCVDQYIATDAWEEPATMSSVCYKKCSFEFENVMYNRIPTDLHDARPLVQREKERDVFYLIKL